MLDSSLLLVGAAALRKAAMNQEAKDYILANKPLYNVVRKAADRYIGGETLDETLVKVMAECARGYKCSIEFMGENTKSATEAVQAKDEFIRIAHEIAKHKLNSTISLDLSHIGLGIDKQLCRENLHEICETAKQTEVIISAEGPDATEQVINMYLDTAKQYQNLSITMQAYLYRSKDDFQALLKSTGRIRVVKGAFIAPAELALPRGDALDDVYLDYIAQLFSNKHACSIATHHDKIQQSVVDMINQYQPARDLYEFESLYGIQDEQLALLKASGHPTKKYFVYGQEWYLYLCNRLAEYPINIFRALNDMASTE